MSSATARIDEGQVLSALRALQQEQWPAVLGLIGYLRYRSAAAPTATNQLTAIDLAQSDVVGIWADRKDIEDSLEYARQLRRDAEHRTVERYDPA